MHSVPSLLTTGITAASLFHTALAAPAAPAPAELHPSPSALAAANLTWPPQEFHPTFEPTQGPAAGTFTEADGQRLALDFMLRVAINYPWDELFSPRSLRNDANTLEIYAGGWPEETSGVQVKFVMWGLYQAAISMHFSENTRVFGKWWLAYQEPGGVEERRGVVELREPTTPPVEGGGSQLAPAAAEVKMRNQEVTFRTVPDLSADMGGPHPYYFALIASVEGFASFGLEKRAMGTGFAGFGTQGFACSAYPQTAEVGDVTNRLMLSLFVDMMKGPDSTQGRFYRSTGTATLEGEGQSVKLAECQIGTYQGHAEDLVPAGAATPATQ